MEDITQQNLIINNQQIKIAEIIEDINLEGSFNAAKKLSKQTHLGIIDAKYVIDCIETQAYHKLINSIEKENPSSEKVTIQNSAEGIIVTYKAKGGDATTVTPNDKIWSHVKSLLKDNNPLIEKFEKEFKEKAKLNSASQNNLFIKERGKKKYYILLIIIILLMIYLVLM